MLGMLIAIAATVAAPPGPPIPLPDAALPIVTLQAGGVQVYRCVTLGEQLPAWILERPAATLYREDGRVFGTHAAGPSWKADDGSSVVADGAAPIARVPQAAAVPWLALRVTSHSGDGILSDARYVERFDTLGGVAPSAAECTKDRLAETRAVHYSAIYEFFR